MKEIEQNLRFMLLELKKQLEATLQVLENPSEEAIQEIENRDDYLDNLKSVVENACFSQIHHRPGLEKRKVDQLRALQTAAINLERLADHVVNIVRQTRHLAPTEFLARYDYQPFFDEIFTALTMVLPAFLEQDMAKAFRICVAEHTLDELYKTRFDRILSELRSGSETGNLVTSLFIFRYLERMGDGLLNLGEAAIFAIMGEKFKIRQYNALRDAAAALGQDLPISDVEFESIWGTRSGCRIGKLTRGGQAVGSKAVIFKEGSKDKLLKERANIERWEKILPGLPPKVLSLREDESKVSLLIEYLGGCTLQDVFLLAEEDTALDVLFILQQTLEELWNSTLVPGPVASDFVDQMRRRLPDVLRLYPRFDVPEYRLADISVPSLRQLLHSAAEVEAKLPAPLTVFIHGDFNINNVVYDHETHRLHYIDLHRSQQADYVQDLSVFLLSNYRLPVFDPGSRHRLEEVMTQMLRFGRDFARRHQDATFEARLTLGLARSFLTSTRFELNRKFARTMLQRSLLLLRSLSDHQAPLQDYRLPVAILEHF